GPRPLAEEYYLIQSRHVLFLYSRFLVAGPGINTAPAVLKLNNGPRPLAEEHYLVQSRHVLFLYSRFLVAGPGINTALPGVTRNLMLDGQWVVTHWTS